MRCFSYNDLLLIEGFLVSESRVRIFKHILFAFLKGEITEKIRKDPSVVRTTVYTHLLVACESKLKQNTLNAHSLYQVELKNNYK